MKDNILAIIYDFDKTLCTKDMQEYTFIPNLGTDSKNFWKEVDRIKLENKMDSILGYMYVMLKKSKEINREIKRSYLNEMGKDIELYPGLLNWFKRINEYGKKKGVIIEHYIVSSGLKEIIEGNIISKYFKEIYASEFLYEGGRAVWPKLAINYTNKTQFIYRINKGILDISDDYNLNRMTLNEDRRIPISNMIYIGDGITDVPSMKTIKDSGGVSIAVYTDKSKNIANTLYNDKRINYMVLADYKNNSEIDTIVKMLIDKKSINLKLNTYNNEDVNV